MEVDYVHGQIERVVKNKNIEGAKKSKPYYKVKYVDYTFFSIIAGLDSIILFDLAGCPGILWLLTLCS